MNVLKMEKNINGQNFIHFHIPKKIIAFLAIMIPYAAICLTFYLWKDGKSDPRMQFTIFTSLIHHVTDRKFKIASY